MKDTESSKNMSINDESDAFHTKFTEQQDDLEKKISSSETVPAIDLKEHFSELNMMLQNMQRIYSASSPYLRIYYRKIHQDALQDLQAKINEAEAKLMPRKKFVFKGKKSSIRTTPNSNGSTTYKSKESGILKDVSDGSDNCVVHDRTDENIVISTEMASGKTVLLSRLRGCKVLVTAAPNTVHISDVQRCSICIGPVTTSVFIESADVCNFQLACQQLRIHQTTDTDFFIHVTSKAIIEDSRSVRFGVYNLSYPTLEQHFIEAGLQKEINNWRDIDDFNWLVSGQSSPNWSLIESDMR